MRTPHHRLQAIADAIAAADIRTVTAAELATMLDEDPLDTAHFLTQLERYQVVGAQRPSGRRPVLVSPGVGVILR
jgi:hypothetical protein